MHVVLVTTGIEKFVFEKHEGTSYRHSSSYYICRITTPNNVHESCKSFLYSAALVNANIINDRVQIVKCEVLCVSDFLTFDQ
jgi:hypothetical protein